MALFAALSRNAGVQWVGKAVLLMVLAYLVLCALLFVAQRRLIYLPSRANAVLPEGFEEWRGTNAAGVVEFWGFKRVGKSAATSCLFFFHGNGGNASGWSHAVEEFPGDIFVLEYPGYGQRPGSPSERSIKGAALKGFEAEAGKYSNIVLAGQSLGGGVTEAIFTRHPEKLGALVLITPYLSLAEVAATHYSWIPARWLVRDRLMLYDAFLKFPGKSLVVTASDDEVIPRSHSLKYHAATNAIRRIVEFPASHNTVSLDREFWERVMSGEVWK
ncbi:MAG TPA: alpha/beta hydrolase [Verrucomicrobiae bacterium]